MATYFETKARYDRMTEDGCIKPVNETILVDAISCTEAETRVIDAISSMAQGDLSVKSTKETKITEVIGTTDGEHFWLAKPALITLDENSGKEKRQVLQILVGADDFDESLKILRDHMNGSMSDWVLTSLSESSIIQYVK